MNTKQKGINQSEIIELNWPFDIGDAWDNDCFKSDYISPYLYNWVVLQLCIVFTVGESPRACSIAIVIEHSTGFKF